MRAGKGKGAQRQKSAQKKRARKGARQAVKRARKGGARERRGASARCGMKRDRKEQSRQQQQAHPIDPIIERSTKQAAAHRRGDTGLGRQADSSDSLEQDVHKYNTTLIE